MSAHEHTCRFCGDKFPRWYWGVSGHAGGCGTIRKPGLARANFERHENACEKRNAQHRHNAINQRGKRTGDETMKNERFYAEHNLMIWRTSDTTRRVWEYSPYDGRIVSYQDQTWKKYRGRLGWCSRIDTTWNNPEFYDGPAKGKLTECPALPPELQGLRDSFVAEVPAPIE